MVEDGYIQKQLELRAKYFHRRMHVYCPACSMVIADYAVSGGEYICPRCNSTSHVDVHVEHRYTSTLIQHGSTKENDNEASGCNS